MRLPDPVRLSRRVLGALLVLAVYAPTHRLLDPERAGPAAAGTLAVVEPTWRFALWGTVSLVLAGTALAILVPFDRVRPVLDHARRALTALPTPGFGALLFVVASGSAALAATTLHLRLPRLVDGMVQLLHARYFEAGRLAGPLPLPAGRLVQNGLLVPEGWVSIYPPGHTAALALGHLAGAVWLVGPVLLGVTALFTFLALERLFAERPAMARLAGLLTALSPFLLLAGSGHLSHASTAAAGAAALYFTVRAWQGSAGWGVLAGAAAAYGITARPWSGLALGAFLTAGVLLLAWWREGRSARWLGARAASVLAGGAPFGAALLAYDARLFGHPLRLGYELAFGPRHGLGLHPDPWGNLYGLREAVGYTGADLVTLGVMLFETPLPAVAVVGVFLLLAPRLSAATRILVGWALLPVLANAFYWHHGQHLGPRMLLEAAPGWIALATVGAVGLVEGMRDPATRGLVEATWQNRFPCVVAFWVFLVALPAAAFLVPERVEGHRWDPDAVARSTPPEIRPGEKALVFVHGSWADRVAARLAADGMRRDSIETALRRNGLCRVHRYERARTAGAAASLPELDLEPEPGSPPSLVRVEIGGTPARLRPGPLHPACAREAAADRFGTVALAPLLWQTALPGSGGDRLLYRDLGRAFNDRVRERFPERTPWLWVPPAPGRPPELLPYDEGMARLWEEGPSGGASGGG